MKYTLKILSTACMLLTLGVGCGGGSRPSFDNRNSEPPVNPKKEETNTQGIRLLNNRCNLDIPLKSGFEITCPSPIKEINFGFFSSGNSLNIRGATINGKTINQVSVKKIAPNRVQGNIADSDIKISLVLEDGTRDVIRID